VWAVQAARWLWLGSGTFFVSEGLLVCYALRGVGGVCLYLELTNKSAIKHNYTGTVIEISIHVKWGTHTRRCICTKTHFTYFLPVYAKPDDGSFGPK
jgi:hypothetical protein